MQPSISDMIIVPDMDTILSFLRQLGLAETLQILKGCDLSGRNYSEKYQKNL